MANKFTYSKMIHTPEGQETFTAVECASFDEAKKMVDAGVRDRNIEINEKYAPSLAAVHASLGGSVLQSKNASVNKPASDPVLPPAAGAPAPAAKDEGGKGPEDKKPEDHNE